MSNIDPTQLKYAELVGSSESARRKGEKGTGGLSTAKGKEKGKDCVIC